METAGGGELVCATIASTLLASGCRVILVSETKNFPEDLDEHFAGAEIRVSPWRAIPFSISHLLNLFYGLVLRLANDNSVLIDTQGLLFGPAIAEITYVHYPGLKEKSQGGARILAMIHLTFSELAKLVIKKQILIFNSRWAAQATFDRIGSYVELGACRPKSHIVYPPVNVEPLLKLPLNSKRRDMVLTISRFFRGKRIERVIPLAKLMPNVRYVIAGRINDPAYFDQLQDLISSEQLESRITLVTNFTQEDKERLLSECAVIVHFAAEEHFGISLIEALAAGSIVIASNFGEAKYFLPRHWLYDRESEIPGLVSDALVSWNEQAANESRKAAMEFSQTVFRNSITGFVDEFFD